MALESFPELVETPFIYVTIGKYTFGMPDKSGSIPGSLDITFPNYMKSLEVIKTNGQVNQYTLHIEYGITESSDPNLIDRVFGSVSDTRLITISYGDWSSPNFVYKEETAIITTVSTDVSFSDSRINYTVNAVSNASNLTSTTFTFSSKFSKPSDVIMSTLYNQSYGLTDVFTGMKDKQKVIENNLICTNDKVVDIKTQNTDPLTYLNYLVNSMNDQTDSGNNIIKNSAYFLTICDDTMGKMGGPYFKISEVPTGNATKGTSSVQTKGNLLNPKNNTTITHSEGGGSTSNSSTSSSSTSSGGTTSSPVIDSTGTNTFEINVGFPGDNFVTDFSVNSDDSWAILYNWAGDVIVDNYTYNITDDGALSHSYSPSLVKSDTYNKVTADTSDWWTKMTQFPISATLVIKGLIRPSILMDYVKIHSYFYGMKHSSSGLYVITNQVDSISGDGYRTTLTLLRIDSD